MKRREKGKKEAECDISWHKQCTHTPSCLVLMVLMHWLQQQLLTTYLTQALRLLTHCKHCVAHKHTELISKGTKEKRSNGQNRNVAQLSWQPPNEKEKHVCCVSEKVLHQSGHVSHLRAKVAKEATGQFYQFTSPVASPVAYYLIT